MSTMVLRKSGSSSTTITLSPGFSGAGISDSPISFPPHMSAQPMHGLGVQLADT
jgi:hypothetical protein